MEQVEEKLILLSPLSALGKKLLNQDAKIAQGLTDKKWSCLKLENSRVEYTYVIGKDSKTASWQRMYDMESECPNSHYGHHHHGLFFNGNAVPLSYHSFTSLSNIDVKEEEYGRDGRIEFQWYCPSNHYYMAHVTLKPVIIGPTEKINELQAFIIITAHKHGNYKHGNEI